VARLPVSDRTRQSLRHVLAAYGATWDDVTGPAHHARTVTMRRAVYWLMHCNGFSLSRIGALTHRDHTSILHGLKKVNSWTRKQ
jgi:chromosomal replication initiation ATPase DnaA